MLVTKHLVKRFGGVVATDDVSLELQPKGIHALIGPNGAGKSTFLALLSGELRPTSGEIVLQGKDVVGRSPIEVARMGISRSYQITSLVPRLTALENVLFGVMARRGGNFRFWRPLKGDSNLVEEGMSYLRRVGLHDRANNPVETLAHGEQRQLEVAMALSTEPLLLLLDEPMAGMGSSEALRMQDLLISLKDDRGILLVEHDMNAVFALADTVTVLVSGSVFASGLPEEIRTSRTVRDVYLGETSVTA